MISTKGNASGLALAHKILKNSPNAIATAIKAVNAGFQTQDGLNTEIELFASCFGTKDFQIGTTAFLTKQKANFRD